MSAVALALFATRLLAPFSPSAAPGPAAAILRKAPRQAQMRTRLVARNRFGIVDRGLLPGCVVEERAGSDRSALGRGH